jgi:hypothetical protein
MNLRFCLVENCIIWRQLLIMLKNIDLCLYLLLTFVCIGDIMYSSNHKRKLEQTITCENVVEKNINEHSSMN